MILNEPIGTQLESLAQVSESKQSPTLTQYDIGMQE